jgi:hypothetical protein
MRKLYAGMAAFLFTLLLPGSVQSADDIIIPTGAAGPTTGKAYLKDNSGNYWPASVTYTTDGAGNVIPVGSASVTIGTVKQGARDASAQSWYQDLEQYLGSPVSVTNPVACEISNGSSFVDPTQIRHLSSGTDSVTVAGSIVATNPSVSATGSAVPADATYAGFKSSGGNLVGVQLTAAGALPVDGSAVTQPISAASLPLPSGAATNAELVTINSTLGSPFQSGGSIGNTAFGISGTLPAFASTPTVNLGTIGSAATAANQTNGSQMSEINNGANVAAVKAASTAAVATDPALVVAISPNNTPVLPSGASTSALQTNGSQTTQIVQGGNTASVTASSALKVDGSAVTQPVSAASLPLPSGAATSSNQTNGNQITQVSSLPAIPTGTNSIGTVGLNAGTNTVGSLLNISGTISLPTGAATAANQATANSSLSTIATNTTPLAQGSTTSGQSGSLSMGAVTTAPPSYSTGQTDPLSLDTTGFLRTTSHSAGTTGTTVPAIANLEGGSDGTNIQALATDTSGDVKVVGSVASGSADSGNPVKIGAKYNSTPVTPSNGNRVDAQASSDGSLIVSQRFAYRLQVTAATVTLKSAEGVLHTICYNTPVNGSVMTVYDNTTNSGTEIALITPPNAATPFCITLDAEFNTGLTFVTTGTGNWTLTYR